MMRSRVCSSLFSVMKKKRVEVVEQVDVVLVKLDAINIDILMIFVKVRFLPESKKSAILKR